MGAFALGSAMTATAGLWDFAGLPWLVAGRFVQGLGGGGLVPLSLALAADLYQDRSRTVALGSIAALQEAGSVFGPLYGARAGRQSPRVPPWLSSQNPAQRPPCTPHTRGHGRAHPSTRRAAASPPRTRREIP